VSVFVLVRGKGSLALKIFAVVSFGGLFVSVPVRGKGSLALRAERLQAGDHLQRFRPREGKGQSSTSIATQCEAKH